MINNEFSSWEDLIKNGKNNPAKIVERLIAYTHQGNYKNGHLFHKVEFKHYLIHDNKDGIMENVWHLLRPNAQSI